MPHNTISTRPKPFVFVLMPLDPAYNDIYAFGIKGAAEDVGAYAERIDEQIFVEGILDRIFNQINKADVIVADMSGRNPNVFYEVGYAHALGKLVLLVTKRAEDIPFDLKHRQHSIYDGDIKLLRTQLKAKLQWAILEVRRRSRGRSERLSMRLFGEVVGPCDVAQLVEEDTKSFDLAVTERDFALPLVVRNDGAETVRGASHVYLFAKEGSALVPIRYERRGLTLSSRFGAYDAPVQLDGIRAADVDAPDGLTSQYRLPIRVLSLPPGASEEVAISLILRQGMTECDELLRVRLHFGGGFKDIRFRLKMRIKPKEKPSEPKEGQ